MIKYNDITVLKEKILDFVDFSNLVIIIFNPRIFLEETRNECVHIGRNPPVKMLINLLVFQFPQGDSNKIRIFSHKRLL